MENSILEAEDEVARLETLSTDPKTVADHRRAGEVFASLSDAQERVQILYARWSELEAIDRGDVQK